MYLFAYFYDKFVEVNSVPVAFHKWFHVSEENFKYQPGSRYRYLLYFFALVMIFFSLC